VSFKGGVLGTPKRVRDTSGLLPRRLLRVALLLASSVVSLGFLEALVRVAGLAPQVSILTTHDGQYMTTDVLDLPYVPNPEHPYFNELGFRDRPRLDGPKHGPRFLVIGDSVVFGGGVERDDGFSARLEYHLRSTLSAFDQAEVWNLGVSGYSTRNEVAFLEHRGLRHEPDFVILGFCLNDFGIHSEELAELEAVPGYTEQSRFRGNAGRYLFAHSDLFRLIAHRTGRLGRIEEGAVPSEAVADVVAGFARLAQLSEKHGFPVLVVVFPFLVPYGDYAFHERHEVVHELAQAHGFHHLDLLPRFRRKYGDDVGQVQLSHTDIIHPNEDGYDLAARVVARFLSRRAKRVEPGSF